MPRQVTPKVLLDALKSERIEEDVKSHLEAFLEETEAGLLSGMKRVGLITILECHGFAQSPSALHGVNARRRSGRSNPLHNPASAQNSSP